MKVVIVGGGFGGLNAAKALGKGISELILIDKTNHHLFQPLLYQVATAALSPGEIATPIREILRKQKNATVIMGNVIDIHKEKNEVILGNGEKIHYDALIVAVGASHSYFGNDNWEQYAPGLKTLSDALQIRDQVFISFEKAERLENHAEIDQYLNFIVIGGGPTGVEMAGAIADIAYQTMFKNFRRIKPEEAKVYLIEGLPRILPMYPEHLSARAKHDLEELGVIVETGKKVTRVTEEGVEVEGHFIRSHNVIWAAGNQASPLLKKLNIPLDRAGRALVDRDLAVPGYPNLFIIGDAACVMGADGNPLPAVAPPAIQEGRYVANIIAKRIPKEKREPFRYRDKGSMATIGEGRAVVSLGKLQFAGLFAWLTWCFIHIVYLIGFRSKFNVLIEWLAHFISGRRGVRLIFRCIESEISPKP
jgi:NADH dehydrogenase